MDLRHLVSEDQPSQFLFDLFDFNRRARTAKFICEFEEAPSLRLLSLKASFDQILDNLIRASVLLPGQGLNLGVHFGGYRHTSANKIFGPSWSGEWHMHQYAPKSEARNESPAPYSSRISTALLEQRIEIRGSSPSCKQSSCGSRVIRAFLRSPKPFLSLH